MDFDHTNILVLIEEDNLVDWSHIEDFFPDVSQIVSTAEPYSLVPLPECIDYDFDELSCLCSSMPTSDESLAIVPYQPCPLSYYTPNELQLDIDFDSFPWSIEEIVPGNIIPSPRQATPTPTPTSGGGSSSSSSSTHEERTITGRRSRLTNIGFVEIRKYFYMPITRAAKEMKVGLTVLKRRCRELGIQRWPHRKMKSLKSLIHNVQELGKESPEENIRKELEMLDMHRRVMEENPEVELTERTKKLRQACFKANYKRRRALQQYPTNCFHHPNPNPKEFFSSVPFC